MTRARASHPSQGRRTMLASMIVLASLASATGVLAQSSVVPAGAPTGARPATDSTKAAAPASPAPAPVPTFFTDIVANAFASFGYTYNANTPTSRLNGYRVFDSDVNTLGVDVVEFVLQKTAAKVGETGFRVDLEAGSAIPLKEQAYGMSVGQSADLQQALLSYIAPVGQGLRLDFGKFVTPLGYEVIEGYDGYNDNYSRSLLFNYAIPLTHTGVKAGYALSSTLSATLMVVNGWDNAKDNNGSKSIGGQVIFVPAEPLTVYMNFITGSEKTDTNGYRRSTYDLVASWKATKVLTFTVNGDYGVEKHASLVTPNADAIWKGVAGYAKFEATKLFSVALRAETFQDEGGTRLGAGAATVRELTVTPSFKLGDRMIARSDLRFDRANVPLFTKNAAEPTKAQTTLAFNVAFVY